MVSLDLVLLPVVAIAVGTRSNTNYEYSLKLLVNRLADVNYRLSRENERERRRGGERDGLRVRRRGDRDLFLK